MTALREAVVADALNRVADALFQQAKAMKRQAVASERSVELQESLYELQQANLAVTKELEKNLAAQTAYKYGPND